MLDQNDITNKKGEKSINLLDIFRYLMFHWRWFLLSVVIFGGYYLYDYSKTPFMYGQSETVMIKTPMNTFSTARITRTNMNYNSVNVAGEILQLKSKDLMRKTISRLNTDVSYSIRKGLRDIELYTESPIQINILNKKEEDYYKLIVEPIDSKKVLIQKDKEKSTRVEVELSKVVETEWGDILIMPTEHYVSSWYGEKIQVRKFPREAMVQYFMSHLEVVQLKDDAALLRVYMEDRSAKRTADMISTLIEVYNEFSKEDKNQIAINTSNFINERLEIIESELGSVESDIERLRTSNQGMDVATAGQFYISDSRQYQNERTKIETDIKLAEMMREYLTNKTKQNELIPNNTGLVDASVEDQIVEYNNTLLKRNRLVEEGSTANPVVKDLDRSLQAMRGNIDRAVDNTVEGLNIKINNIRREEQQAREKALTIPQKQRVMLSVERQQKVKEELYLYLLNKREENALNKAMTEDNIRVIDPASGPITPIYPIKMRKILMGVGLGVVIPAIVLLILLMFDTGVRTKQEVENHVTIPFLAEIPLARRGQKAINDVVVSSTGRDPLTESFRILRTNINFMTTEGMPPKILTFTSFGSGAGKTFCALNLAATLSYLNKKIVVLDLDLRKGTLSAREGINSGKGVSHYLSNTSVCLEDILRRSNEADNIDFIPIGMIAPNPVELLLSQRLDGLIQELKSKYDYIIVDSVPVGVVADASIVDRISDLTLFVIRSGKLDRRQLPELEYIYKSKKLSNLAIVLNGVKIDHRGYGYGTYAYGSGYGYSYGEGAKKGFFNKLRGK